MLAGIATVTERIRLASGVTVLSSDDPVRVFQRFATVDALSGGRPEVILGRGSFTESFPLSGYGLKDYEPASPERPGRARVPGCPGPSTPRSAGSGRGRRRRPRYAWSMNATPRWLTPEEQAAWDGFIRMQEKLIGRLSRYVQADSGMSAADFIVLAKLTEAGGRMRFMDLTKLVEWEKSRMSHQVGRMARRGLVGKEECPDDGRGSFVVATPAGYQAIEEAAPVHVEHVRRLFIEALAEDELAALTKISGRVIAHLEKQAD